MLHERQKTWHCLQFVFFPSHITCSQSLGLLTWFQKRLSFLSHNPSLPQYHLPSHCTREILAKVTHITLSFYSNYCNATVSPSIQQTPKFLMYVFLTKVPTSFFILYLLTSFNSRHYFGFLVTSSSEHDPGNG